MICQRFIPLLFILIAMTSSLCAQEVIWRTSKGKVQFKSDAPLEMIDAESKSLHGVIDPGSKSFAFTVSIKSFEGFNSAMQQVHFLENYLEERKYPQASFSGKIIEDIPFNSPGTYQVRAKGKLNIHGIIKERIIRGTLIIGKETFSVQAQFMVPVTDHGISIPRIVNQKIAEQISVTVQMDFVEGIKS